jgi:hypothetical protein
VLLDLGILDFSLMWEVWRRVLMPASGIAPTSTGCRPSGREIKNEIYPLRLIKTIQSPRSLSPKSGLQRVQLKKL